MQNFSIFLRNKQFSPTFCSISSLNGWNLHSTYEKNNKKTGKKPLQN